LSSALVSLVTIHITHRTYLVVCEPVQRVPEEDLAGENTTADFVNPGIVKCHESRESLATCAHGTRFNTVPETLILQEILTGALLASKSNKLPRLAHNRAGGGRKLVSLLEVEEDGGAKNVTDGRESETQPEADEVLRVHHSQGSSERSSVDE
jgi:hypothetical protein